MKALHSLIRSRGALRLLKLALGCIALCTTVAAQAAEAHPSEDDWFTAYFVEGYGFLVLFVVAIIALLVFRKLHSTRAGDSSLAKAASRVEVQLQPTPAPAENRKPASAVASKETEPRERGATPREPVRNQAVTSLGQLKQPAAIGALLDIGRRYSDIPPLVLSESLSTCSVEGLDFHDSAPFDLNDLMAGAAESSAELEPLTSVEQLPTGDEDDGPVGSADATRSV